MTKSTARILQVGDKNEEYPRIRDLVSAIEDPVADLERVGGFAAAREHLLSHRHDIILIPHMLPGGSGLDLLREIAGMSTDICAIMLVDEDAPDVEAECLRLGAVDCLTRSELTRPVLRRAIRRAMTRIRERSRLRECEQLLRVQSLAVEHAHSGVLVVDMARDDRPVVYANPAYTEMTGYGAADVLDRPWSPLRDEDGAGGEMSRIRQTMADGGEVRLVLRDERKNGSDLWYELHLLPVHDDQQRITHYVGVHQEITDSHAFEDDPVFRAGHDPLTGIPNRLLLMDRVEQAVAAAERKQRRLALLHIDMDRFKSVNDSHGHIMGDELLRMVAGRLRECARGTDTVARLAGDEFVMLCTDLSSDDDVGLIARRVEAAMAYPMEFSDVATYMTCSIGISLYPRDALSSRELIRNAGLAMNRAKAQGRNGYAIFTEELNETLSRRLILINELHRAVARDQFHLEYQPQFSVRTNKVVGLEALLRWNHPELGAVSPTEFIPLAEETGLIVGIGEWVLRTACRQQREWVARGLPSYRIAVNVSACQFVRRGLMHTVRSALEETGMPPSMLELELTESLLMENATTVVDTLRGLRRLGVSLSIDDFGTGYCSLGYLKRFPIDRLKIDRSFVNDITVDSEDAAIVQAMVAMAHSLRLGVVAEGVETREQFMFLRALGCEAYQGYLFSYPLPVTGVNALGSGRDIIRAIQPGRAEEESTPEN